MRPLDELAKQAQELNMGYEKPITCAEAGKKGGSARSAKKTAANRANAKLPRKKQSAQPTGKRYASVADLIADKPAEAIEFLRLTKLAEEKLGYPTAKEILAKQPAEWIKEASASARAMVSDTTRKAAKALLGKQNAPQSRFRPKVGQVWRLDGGAIEWTISSVTMDNVISSYDIKRIGIGSSAYDKEQWLADRKSGVIRIVRASK